MLGFVRGASQKVERYCRLPLQVNECVIDRLQDLQFGPRTIDIQDSGKFFFNNRWAIHVSNLTKFPSTKNRHRLSVAFRTTARWCQLPSVSVTPALMLMTSTPAPMIHKLCRFVPFNKRVNSRIILELPASKIVWNGRVEVDLTQNATDKSVAPSRIFESNSTTSLFIASEPVVRSVTMPVLSFTKTCFVGGKPASVIVNPGSNWSAVRLSPSFRFTTCGVPEITGATFCETNGKEPTALELEQSGAKVWARFFFIWLDGKHPAVVGSIFTYQHNNKVFRRHELISLSGEPLVARLDGQEVWKPKPASIEGTLVAEDLIPATTAPRRLTQMRTIARELAGRHISADGKVSELRLLPQPLFRYDAPEAGIIDGAIFTLSVATDPEILVVLEARSIDSVSNWYIVPFRSHFDALELSYKGKQIWSASTNLNLKMTKALQLPFALEPYFIFTPRIPLPPAEKLKWSFINFSYVRGFIRYRDFAVNHNPKLNEGTIYANRSLTRRVGK